MCNKLLSAVLIYLKFHFRRNYKLLELQIYPMASTLYSNGDQSYTAKSHGPTLTYLCSVNPGCANMTFAWKTTVYRKLSSTQRQEKVNGSKVLEKDEDMLHVLKRHLNACTKSPLGWEKFASHRPHRRCTQRTTRKNKRKTPIT